jgi:hypothetical protein
MGVTVGYVKPLGGGSWLAIEGDVDVMGTSANTLQGLSLNGPMAFDQRLLYGGGYFDSLLQLFGSVISLGAIQPFPASSLPGAPGRVTGTSMYGFGGVSEKDISANFGLGSNKAWSIAPEVGIGLRTSYASGFVTDASVFAIMNDKSFCVGAVGGAACAGVNAEMGARFRLIRPFN